eukprot:5487881-Pyramimonas_sp.AAC.1
MGKTRASSPPITYVNVPRSPWQTPVGRLLRRMSTADIVDREAEIAIVDREAEIARLREQLRAMQEENSTLREAAASQPPTDVEGSQHHDTIVEGESQAATGGGEAGIAVIEVADSLSTAATVPAAADAGADDEDTESAQEAQEEELEKDELEMAESEK